MPAPVRYTPGGVDETTRHGYPAIEGGVANVTAVVSLTAAQYAAIKVPNPGTLYLIHA